MQALLPGWKGVALQGHDLVFGKIFGLFFYYPSLTPWLWLALGFAAWGLSYLIKKRRVDSGKTFLLSFPIILIFKAYFFYQVINFAFQRIDLGINRVHINTRLELSTALGALILSFLGTYDDRKPISGKIKLGVIGLMWFMKVATIALFTPLTPSSTAGWFYLLICGIIALFVTIALPLWDGLHGLFPIVAASLALLIFNVLTPICIMATGNVVPYTEFDWLFSGLTVVGTSGIWLFAYLPWNFPNGKTRLGEAAVIPISFLLPAIIFDSLVYRLEPSCFSSYSGGDSHGCFRFIDFSDFFIFLAPVADLLMVTVFRFSHKRSVFAGGHDHLHHRLVQSGCADWLTALLLFLPIAILVIGRHINYFYFFRHDLVLFSFAFSIYIYLFWRGYAKVNPYKSGAVDERGRP